MTLICFRTIELSRNRIKILNINTNLWIYNPPHIVMQKCVMKSDIMRKSQRSTIILVCILPYVRIGDMWLMEKKTPMLKKRKLWAIIPLYGSEIHHNERIKRENTLFTPVIMYFIMGAPIDRIIRFLIYQNGQRSGCPLPLAHLPLSINTRI